MLKSIEINKYNVLTSEEERALIKKIQEDNDQQALNKLICHNIKFIIHVINKKMGNKDRYAIRNGSFIKDDLMQECYFALVKAAKNFDLERPGIRYIQYAKFWVTAVTQDYFHKNNHIVKNSVGDVFLSSDNDNIDRPTGGNLLERVIENSPAKENFQSFSEFEKTEDTILIKRNEKQLSEILLNMKKRLSDKEISILSDRLMAEEPLTLAEIGAKYNVSRERIRQIEARLIIKLKKRFNEEGLVQNWR